MVFKTVRSHGWRSQAYTDVLTACFENHARIPPSAPKLEVIANQQDTAEAPRQKQPEPPAASASSNVPQSSGQ